MSAGRRISTGLRHVVALTVTFLFTIPLVFMMAGSLRPLGPPPQTLELIPDRFDVSNFGRTFELVDLPRYAVNSLLVVVVAVPLTVLVASWAGFAMARLQGRAATVMVVLTFVALMVPATALMVPRFAIFRTLGLTDTFIPLIAPSLLGTSPFYVLLFYWSFKRLPAELFEAARLEGAAPLAVWWRVAMPLARPVTVAVAVLAFTFTWSNFLDPLIYLFDENLYTLPLGLRALAQLDRENYPLMLAGAVTAT
ncbi:MAG: carbohydrate ABC transporter permease, partial [Actinomycetota bacterium]